MIITNLNELSHNLWKFYVNEGEIALDATCGNGHDTKRLLEIVGRKGKVYAVDIQESAIKRCKKENEDAENVVYITDSHSNIDEYINNNNYSKEVIKQDISKGELYKKELSIAVFNLGYLPNSSHEISTNASSTIIAMEKAIKLLKKEGILSVTAYLGHDDAYEYKSVAEFFKKLNPKAFKVIEINPLNQNELSPKLFICQKL